MSTRFIFGYDREAGALLTVVTDGREAASAYCSMGSAFDLARAIDRALGTVDNVRRLEERRDDLLNEVAALKRSNAALRGALARRRKDGE